MDVISSKKSIVVQHILLVAAVLLSPVVLRLIILMEKDVGFRILDLHGILSDAVVSLFIVIIVLFLYKWKWWSGILIVALWSILNYGNYEHIKALNINAQIADAGYLLDWTFLRGSALTASRPLLLLGILSCAGIIALLALRKKDARFRLKALFILALVTLGVSALWPQDYEALTWRQSHFVFENIRRIATSVSDDAEMKLSEVETREIEKQIHADLSGRPVVKLDNHGTNVLLIMLESVSGAYLDTVARKQGIESSIKMPKFDTIAKENIVLHNFLTHQRLTSRGEYSVLCGDYPKLVTGNTRMNEIVQMNEDIMCLPEVLQGAGYETVYLQAAPLGFMLKDQFMKRSGFFRYYGDQWFKQAYERNTWGVDDRAYFEQSLQMVRELQLKGTPWFMAMLTVGTHDPYNVPLRFDSGFPKDSMGHAVAYLDNALEEFIKALQDMNVLENTLVLITSDESAGLDQGDDDMTKKLSQNWGVLIVISPGKERIDVQEKFGQIDLAVSILDYLGLRDNIQQFAGRSIFREYENDRILFFANRNMIGSIDASDDLLLCWDEFKACNKYDLQEHHLFSPHRIKMNINRNEIAVLSTMAHRGVGPPEVKSKDFQLIASREIPLNIDKKQLIFGGQYLRIPVGFRTDVDLDVEISGEDGQVVLINTLISRVKGKETAHYTKATPPLGPGDTVTLRYSYLADQDLRGVECQLFSRKLWGKPMKLNIKEARLRLKEPNIQERELHRGRTERAYLINGTAYSDMELIDKTIDQYSIAVNYKPNDPEVHLILASACSKKGLIDKAIKHFRVAMRLHPNDTYILKEVGKFYLSHGLIKDAMEQYERALRLDPGDVFIHYTLGIIYGKEGLFKKAIDHYELAIHLEPDFFQAHNNLANIYLKNGMIDKAIDHFQAALKLQPEIAMLHFNIADAYRQKGWTDKAEQHVLKAESLMNRQ